MLGDIGIKLACKVNKDESLLEFIRNSEKEFELPKKDVFSMEINELDNYVDELDYLWTK